MTEHGRKSLGLEHIIYIISDQKQIQKTVTKIHKNHNTKKWHPKCCDGKKRGYKIESVSGDDLF